MAENQDIAFNVTVPGEGGKSLKDLKKDFNDIQKELANLKVGTKEYQHALERLGAVKDDIGDLRDTINALNPEGKVAAFAKVGSTIASGFAAAQGAAALFGAESEELQKTILKVQAAMALAEGIKGIAGASDAFKVLNAVMKANPIAAIIAGFTALAGVAVVLYNSYKDANSESAKLEANHIKLKASTDSLIKSIDTEITSLKGLKTNDEAILELTEKKLKLNIELERSSLRVALAKNKEQQAEFDYNEQALRLIGKNAEADQLKFTRTKESRDAAIAAGEALKASIAGLSQFQNEERQKDLDKHDDYLKNKSDLDKEKLAQDKKHIDELLAYQKQAQDDIDNYIHQANVNARKRLEDTKEEEKAFDDEELNAGFNNLVDGQKKEEDAVEESEKKKRAAKQKTFDDTIGGTKQALQMTQQLTDMFFDYQLKKNKGNAAAELEIRKKQFKVNKAFGIVNAVVDGVGAVQKALNNPYPLNLILAVLSGVLAAANVAKIASSKFEGGDSSASAGDVGSVGTASAPAIPQPNNTATTISDDGKVTPKDPGPQKVFIVETEIKDSNKRVANIEETAKI